MAFSLQNKLKEDVEVKFEGGLAGKKILIYGKNNTGKTYQTNRLSKGKTFLIATEAGDGAVASKLKEPCGTWAKFKEIVADFTKTTNVAQYRELVDVIVIDTAENLIELSENAIASEYGVRSVGDVQQAKKGNPNGYLLARQDFKAQINKLCLAGYCVVFIAHEETIDDMVDEVTGATYTFIQPKGTSNEKASMKMLMDLCDFTIYIKPNPVDPQTFKVVPSTAICVRTKNVFARSRFDIVPMINPFTAEALKQAIEDAVKKSAENEGVGIVDFDAVAHDGDKYTKEDYLEIIQPYAEKLFDVCGEEVISIIEAQLGVGRTLDSATDNEITNLEAIYNNLVTKATMLGIDV